MSDLIERFEKAVRANHYRTNDDLTEKEYVAAKAALTACVHVPAVEPVAWRWKFDPEGAWHYGDTHPGPFRFGDPDIIEPLYLTAPGTGGAHPGGSHDT